MEWVKKTAASRSVPVASRRARGLALHEVVIVVAVVSIIAASLGSVLISSQLAFAETSITATTDDLARRVLDRVAAELRFAEPGTLAPAAPVDSPTISFSPITGWDGESPITGATRTITFSSGTVLLDGAPIAAGLSDLAFTLAGELLTIEIEISRQIHVGGESRTVVRTLERQIRL